MDASWVLIEPLAVPSQRRELDWLIDELHETLTNLKHGLEDCYALLAPIDPGSTLVLSTPRNEIVKGHVTRVGTRIVKGVRLHSRSTITQPDQLTTPYPPDHPSPSAHPPPANPHHQPRPPNPPHPAHDPPLSSHSLDRPPHPDPLLLLPFGNGDNPPSIRPPTTTLPLCPAPPSLPIPERSFSHPHRGPTARRPTELDDWLRSPLTLHAASPPAHHHKLIHLPRQPKLPPQHTGQLPRSLAPFSRASRRPPQLWHKTRASNRHGPTPRTRRIRESIRILLLRRRPPPARFPHPGTNTRTHNRPAARQSPQPRSDRLHGASGPALRHAQQQQQQQQEAQVSGRVCAREGAGGECRPKPDVVVGEAERAGPHAGAGAAESGGGVGGGGGGGGLECWAWRNSGGEEAGCVG